MSRTKEWTKGEREKLVYDMLHSIGENPERDGLKDTPARVVRAYDEMFSGLKVREKDIEKMLTKFEGKNYSEMIVMRRFKFISYCEHHLLPFEGKACVGYIPGEHILGASKLIRLLNVYAKRPQIQERICVQVTNSLMKYVEPQGSGCILVATHGCISCRGVEKPEAEFITSSLQGSFQEDKVRAEFLAHLE